MLHLNIVELGTGLLNRGLGGALVDDEHKGVVVFNGLDNALRRKWVLHDRVLVPGGLILNSVGLDLRVASQGLGLRESERHFVPDLCFFLGMSAFLHCASCNFSLNNWLRWLSKTLLTYFAMSPSS